MNFFNFDLKKLVMIGIVLALPLISINMQQRPQESNWLSKPFTMLASAVSETFYGFSHGVTDTTAMYVNLINIKKHSEELKSTNNELQARLEKMNELLLENDRLRGLLTFKEQTKMSLMAAQVIGRDLVIDHNTVTINKGTNDGLKAGQAVITTGGVLGYIFKPEPFTSHVMLITDRYAVVDGLIQRTRARGIVEGKSQYASTLQLKYVERTEDVQEGDMVVTGGLDNIFPKGFPVAVVESVEKKTFSVSLKVDLRPVVDPYKVEEVFVVLSAAAEDFGDKYAPQAATEGDTVEGANGAATAAPVATPAASPAATAKPTATATPAVKPVAKPSPVATPAQTPKKPEEKPQ
ncbi:rod shape-determining protein MreC [Bdellovibrio bacteriovorus]|uniref:Cell shape-determining protein MreC n=1 Tax=Bdellovibrio bacteriovorus TaxID=959 RepID=A0A162GBD3_BDEBC|nr:rod shape-determining protein MreC [Bdellovibrio bacteriovorus]KYG67721.1 rod shape-determining protein MreC [Bdellovibrio bacteriovorus]